MTINRRDLLKLAAAATAGQVLSPVSVRASLAPNRELTYSLFCSEQDLPRLRRLFIEHSEFAQFRQELMAFDLETEWDFVRNDVRYNDQLYDIGRLGRGAEAMALRYLLTGETETAEFAAAAINELLKFEHWDYYMEAGKTIGIQRATASTVAISLVADWLGDFIEPEERSRWFTVMGERGCEPAYLALYGMRYPREVEGWHFDSTSTFYDYRPDHRTDLNRRPEILLRTNLRIVPAAALAVGAVAHKLEHGLSDDANRWLEMAIYHLRESAEIYTPDGSYDEGVGYANYSSLHMIQATALLKRHGGPDLQDLVNWEGYSRFVLNMSLPTEEDPHEIVNFGDNGNPKPGGRGRNERTAVQAWIASEYDSGLAQWLSNNRTGKRDHWALMWYTPSIEERVPEPGPHLWISDLDWVVARSGWGVDDLVVAMRSGPPANHEHADRNSIIVKCFGQQLVTDPYRPPYLFAHPSWRMRLTEGHSAVLIDGQGHEHHNGVEGTNASRSFARITDSDRDRSHAWWASDATQPYRLVNLDVRQVVREIVTLYDVPAVIVVDRVKKYDEASIVQSRFYGYNWDGDCRQIPLTDGFRTERPGAVMRAHVFANVDHDIVTALPDIPEEDAVRHPYAEVQTRPSKDALIVTALAIARDREALPAVSFAPAGNGVTVSIGNRSIEVGERVVVS